MGAARIRTADINGCKLCLGMRAARDRPGHLERSGGDPSIAVTARSGDTPPPDEAFYEAVRNGDAEGLLSERERLLAEYAERFGSAPKSMDDDEPFWAQLNDAFSVDAIVDSNLSTGHWAVHG